MQKIKVILNKIFNHVFSEENCEKYVKMTDKNYIWVEYFKHFNK